MIDIWPDGDGHLPGQVKRQNWGETMVDAALWRPVIDDIGAAIGLQSGSGVIAGFPGSSAVFLIGQEAVVKLFPPFFAADFQVEQTVYELLHGRLQRMPILLASGTYHDQIDWPFLVLSYRSGQPIRDLLPRLKAGQRVHIARQAGLALRAVHATALGERSFFRAWPEFLAERQANCLVELRGKTPLPAALVDAIAAFLAEIVPELALTPGVLVNADLTDDHALLVEREGSWQLNAIIDWADAEVAHPSYEWIAAWFGFCRRDPAMFRALVSACDPEKGFDQAFRRELLALTFLHRFGALIVAESWQTQPLTELSLEGLQNWLWTW